MVMFKPKKQVPPKQPAPQPQPQPQYTVDPMLEQFGYVQPPGADSGFMDRYRYINQVNPSALMQLGAGIMAGDIAGGFGRASEEMQRGAGQQQRAKLAQFGYQEQQKNKNLTRQWLINQGYSPQDADAAMANPTILSELLKPPDKRNLITVGDRIYDADNDQWIEPGGAGGGFDLGTGTDARALEYLVETNVLTPQQAAEVAAGKTITNPADGSMWFMTPQGLVGRDAAGNPIDPNAAAAEQPAGSGGVAGGRQVTPAKPIVGTEGERRAQLLYGPTKRQEKIALDNYDALSSKMGIAVRVGEQIPRIGGIVKTLGDFATTTEYQQARNALKTIYTNWLYATSGATATPSEQETQADLLMPRPGEDAASVEGKKQQIRDYVAGIEKAQGVLAAKPNRPKPAAIPQATWDAMTDDEKAQF